MDNGEKLIYSHGINASIILSTLPILSPTESGGGSLALPKTHPLARHCAWPRISCPPIFAISQETSLGQNINSTEGISLAVT